MADNTTRATGDDQLAAEIARLRRELSNLKAALAERADDIAGSAGRAADAVDQPIRSNPGTADMFFGCLVGLLVGLAIGQALAGQRPRNWWHDRYW